ncbi:MAG: aldo/keto reductase [Planctomycetes bacterium]|nr:aldo/keto reductase [Planctomycetota bacterium]
MKSEHTLERRDFLRNTATIMTAVAVGERITPADASAAIADPPASAIPTRTLGKTGLQLPILGYGGAALPTAWRNPLSHEDRVALVRYAFDRGVRYFDTAGNYMESQAILGEALQDRRRDVCLVTKVETTKPDEVRKAVEKSLKELQTDYLDILLIHGSPGLEQMSVEQAMKIHGELVKLRDEKITRFVGFSAHGYFEKALALINSGGFEICMLSYGYMPRGSSSVWSPRMTKLRDDCLAKAHEMGMGIVAMKVIGGGWLGRWSGYLVPSFDKQRLKELPAAAIRHVLQDQRVHLLAIGMHLKSQIDANLKTLTGDTTCTPEDRALLAEFSAKLLETDTVKKMQVE